VVVNLNEAKSPPGATVRLGGEGGPGKGVDAVYACIEPPEGGAWRGHPAYIRIDSEMLAALWPLHAWIYNLQKERCT
jgi:hypothetical protein